MVINLCFVLYGHKINAAGDRDTAIGNTVPLKTKFPRVHKLLFMGKGKPAQQILDPDIDIGLFRNRKIYVNRWIERVRIGIGDSKLRWQ